MEVNKIIKMEKIKSLWIEVESCEEESIIYSNENPAIRNDGVIKSHYINFSLKVNDELIKNINKNDLKHYYNDKIYYSEIPEKLIKNNEDEFNNLISDLSYFNDYINLNSFNDNKLLKNDIKNNILKLINKYNNILDGEYIMY